MKLLYAFSFIQKNAGLPCYSCNFPLLRSVSIKSIAMKFRKFLLIPALAFTAFHTSAQGIVFDSTSTFAQVKAHAAREHKLLYVDVYTTWCGPCKMMARNYFPTGEAGDFYNKNFVCYKIDAEKGEGVQLAKAYNVSGYPTNLFLDGATGKVIFRTMGMPQNLEGFLHNGSIAQEEKKDPMNLDDYAAKLKTGKYSQAFLEQYMEKNMRLSVDNDSLLDVYAATYYPQKVSDSALLFIFSHQTGVENEAYKMLTANAARLDKLQGQDGKFESRKTYFYHQALSKYTKVEDEPKFQKLLSRANEFEMENKEDQLSYYEKEFYKNTGQTEKLQSETMRHARHLVNMSEPEMESRRLNMMENLEQQVRWQLSQMDAKPDEMEKLVAENMERPQIKYASAIAVANELNEAAWSIYELSSNQKVSSQEISEAKSWAAKAMMLSELVPESWVPIADTYAHLLAISGNKTAAKVMEKKAITTAKENGISEVKDYEDYLKELEQN